MPYTTNVAGTTITAAWGNANVRDQVVTPFATAAARTSAITVPVEGMVSYLQDTNVLDGYDAANWGHISYIPGFVLARKGSDQAVASTTLADDADLQVPVVANATYQLTLYGIYTASTAGDLKGGWSGPSGAALDWTINGPASDQNTLTGIHYNGWNTIAGTDNIGGAGGGAVVFFAPMGILTTTTAGTLKWRFAQATSDATGTTMKSGSTLLLRQVA